MKIGILDYKACNIASVFHSVYNLGHDPVIIKKKNDFKKVDKLIIPGVGAANHCMKYLKNTEMISEITKYKNKGMSILGICLGMQIFSKTLFEHGKTDGLGFINGEVIPINKSKNIFNIGWCNITINNKNDKIDKINIKNNSSFFFCHSYFLNLNKKLNNDLILGEVNIGKTIPAIIIKDNIIGVQFHPEKSQENGASFLNFFINEF